ncbi:DUF5908 family protein [Sphingomonas sp. AR_OL41]|jgi:hypothetical protein|uniref:DUF5908 family protein n=1 Tax=Sphingomonas sp. AR_OL41 TaxID=3042729 RepID=UPI002480BF08|nr:DUF5908 family protein [Sphingomonas sp. AR_OL41]MDH7975896.1 DUF5908 family protein [Sphingomonas sp. AR_OL41]
MPLEISEIGVHIAVGGITPSAPPLEHGAAPDDGAALSQAHIEQIVSSCVSQVLKTLRQREER